MYIKKRKYMNQIKFILCKDTLIIVFVLNIYLYLWSTAVLAQSVFQMQTVNGTPAFDAVVNYCGQKWGEYLNSSVPIKVKVYYANLFGQTLGITIPNGRRDFLNAPIDSVWYPTSLANALAGVELNPGEDDMNIFIDNTANWYMGLDGNPPANKYDLVSVVMHEIAHGLGFLALSNIKNGEGSFGYIDESDLAPLVLSFPFPDLQGKYAIYSTFIENLSGQQLDDTLIFANPSLELAAQFTGNQLYFNGVNAVLANNNQRVRLYAPATFAFGSSLHHLDENTYPPSNPNTMMTPFIAKGESHLEPGPVALAILQDLGWSVNLDASVENMKHNNFTVFPNPATDYVYVQAYSPVIEPLHWEIVNVSGVVIQQGVMQNTSAPVMVTLHDLPAGLYFCRVGDAVEKMMVVK